MNNFFTSLVLALTTSAFATTWTVDDDGLDDPNADFNNIQAVIDATSNGDTALGNGAGLVMGYGFDLTVWFY